MAIDPSTDKLFREDVFAARQDAWLGEVVLMRSISGLAMSLGFAVMALALIAFLIWGEYTRKIRVGGYVVPDTGVIKLAATQPGVVSRLNVQEGQRVSAGETLAVLNSERSIGSGAAFEAIARQLELRRASLQQERIKQVDIQRNQASALDARIGNLRVESAQLQAALQLQEARIVLTEQLLDGQRKLHADRFISDAVLQQKEQDRMADLAALESVRRSRTSLMRELGAAEADRAALPSRQTNELAVIDRSLFAIEQDQVENESRRELLLKAPQGGTVTAILTDAGRSAAPGQPLLNLIPEGAELQADAYLPTRAAGFVRFGMRAMLQFHAFPYQKFGSHEARVIRLSRVAIAGSELPYAPPAAATSDLYYIATLALAKKTVSAYGKEEPLQAGMGFDANLILDTRTLLEWVFEPLYSVSGNWLR